MAKTVILKCDSARSFCKQRNFAETHVRFFAKGMNNTPIINHPSRHHTGSSTDGEEIYPLGAEIVEINIQTVTRAAADKLSPVQEWTDVQFTQHVVDGKFQPQACYLLSDAVHDVSTGWD